MWKEFGVQNSFTWETSQYGYIEGKKVIRFTDKDYSKIAYHYMETLYFYTQMLKKTKQGIKGSKLDKTPRNTNKNEKKMKLRIHQVIASKLIKNSKPTFKHNISFPEPTNKTFFNSSLTNYFKKQSLEEVETDTNEFIVVGPPDNGEVKSNALLSLLKKPNSTNNFSQPCSNPILSYIQKEIINVNYIRNNRNQWK